jgi:two-component sensor histidine kinase
VNIAIPCGLIVNELVTNALKHAFRDVRSGTVAVRARHSRENLIELSVADDGRGLPLSLDPRKSPSLGLDLVFTFAEQLGAEVEIARQRGTVFTFRFREEAA